MSDVCDAQDDVMSDLSALVALDPSTNTTEDYQSVLGDIEDDVENLVSARSDLGDADVDSVESAFDDVRSELEGLDDEPLSEVLDDAGQAVVDGAADLMQQYETAYDNSSCTE